MKRLLFWLFLGIFVAGTVSAQPRNTDRSRWKSAKKMAKELVAEGWKVDGSRALEDLIFEHYQKLTDENNQELVANVVGQTSVKILNQAAQWAATNASISYAKQARQMVAGRITAEFGAGVAESPSVDNFYEGYESRVAKELNGELKKSFSVYREKKEGGIDYRAFYLVNEEAASSARMRALERMKAESEFLRENAEKISEFVREGFPIEPGE